jgi:hypothetical protein
VRFEGAKRVRSEHCLALLGEFGNILATLTKASGKGRLVRDKPVIIHF